MLLPDCREGEEFRPVAGFESYLVSNQGRVFSLPKGNWRGGLMKLQTPGTGKYAFVLLRDRKRRKTSKVHRLVAEAFIAGPRKEGIIRHLNGNGLENRVENLAWGTSSENALDKVLHGTHPMANKTHCPQGHPYDGISLGIQRHRFCRVCLRDRARDRRARFGRYMPPTAGPTAAEIRRWAEETGLECAARGPIPHGVRGAFAAASEQRAS